MDISTDLGSLAKRFSYGRRMRPERDWFVLLAVAAVLVLASAAWNLWLFAKVEQGYALDADAVPATFDAAPIESVRAVFEERRAEELRYRQEYRFVDPSR